MSVVVKDAKIEKAETILKINKIIFIVYVILTIIAGIILTIIAIVNRSWMYFGIGAGVVFSILGAWIEKQFLDGYGLIVYNSAVSLHKQEIVTLLDVDQMEAEKKEEKKNTVLSESIEERLKKDFGNKKEDE